jgi:hypothetical protein
VTSNMGSFAFTVHISTSFSKKAIVDSDSI